MGLSEVCGKVTSTITINGKEYILSAIKIGDYADIEDSLKLEKKKELNTLCEEASLTGLEKVKLINDELSKIDALSSLTTLSGIIHLVYFSLKKKQQDITIAQVKELVDLSNMQEFSSKIGELANSGLPSGNEKGQTAEQKK